MNSFNKRTIDFETGIEWRESRSTEINNLFNPKNARLERLHKHLRMMTFFEKAVNNKLLQRITEVGYETAMGIDYVLMEECSSKRIPIILRRLNDWDVFYKLPSPYAASCEGMQDFLDNVLANYHMLFLNSDGKLSHYKLLPMLFFIERNWILRLSEGNENRIAFYHHHHPFKPSGFTKNPVHGRRRLFSALPSLEIALRDLL